MDEDGEYVKSLCPWWSGLQSCYKGEYKKTHECELQWIFKNHPTSDYFLKLGNMNVRAASNHRLVCYGEYVS